MGQHHGSHGVMFGLHRQISSLALSTARCSIFLYFSLFKLIAGNIRVNLDKWGTAKLQRILASAQSHAQQKHTRSNITLFLRSDIERHFRHLTSPSILNCPIICVRNPIGPHLPKISLYNSTSTRSPHQSRLSTEAQQRRNGAEMCNTGGVHFCPQQPHRVTRQHLLSSIDVAFELYASGEGPGWAVFGGKLMAMRRARCSEVVNSRA